MAVLIATCVGLSWSMVPRHGELIERLVKDKQYERVVAVLQEGMLGMRPSERGGSWEHLDAKQFSALSQLLNLTPREQLQAVFGGSHPPIYDAYVHGIILAAVRYVDVIPPEEAVAIIEPGIDRVPEARRMQLLNLLSSNALAVKRADLAARLLKLACQCSDATWTMARDMVQAYRWAGQPTEGSRELGKWVDTHEAKLAVEEVALAQTLHYTLALEAGDPSTAFDVCLHQLAKEQTPALATLERAYNTALQSTRTKELLPWLEKFVRTLPESTMSIGELHREAKAAPERFAVYQHWGLITAQWEDWNDDYDAAFPHHLRLAALGNESSLERCLDIGDAIGGAEECCELLLLVGDEALKPSQRLLLARLLAELGRENQAKEHYEAWLANHPEDRDTLYDYACLVEDMGDEPAGRKAFAILLARHPQDVGGIKKLAEACIRDADYTTALHLYEKLPDDSHDYHTLENYTMLAQSLDNHAVEFRALSLQLAKTENPQAALYLDLLDSSKYLNDPGKTLEVLIQAVAKVPDSHRLRIALAQAHIEDRRIPDAVATLSTPGLQNNFEAVQILLSLSSEPEADALNILQFLGNNVEKRLPLTMSNCLDLAVLQYRAGNITEMQRLFAKVPVTSRNGKLLAEAKVDVGNYQEAAQLLTSYLKAQPKANPDDWLLLGDIYEELGQFEDAQNAYNYSLALLTADIPSTAAN